MKDFELDERKGEVVDTKYLYGKQWDVLESFLFDHSRDQDYFLLSFDGNDVYLNNYYGYVVIRTNDNEILFSGL